MRYVLPVASLVFFATLPARADPRFVPDFVAHDARVEIGIVAASSTPFLALLLPQSRRGLAPDAPRTTDDGSATASNIVVSAGTLTVVLGAAAAEALESSDLRWDYLRASMVSAEGALFAASMTSIPKRLLGRCRPEAWDAARRTCIADTNGSTWAYESFWSAHTATIAGAAGAALCLGLRDGNATWPILVGAFGEVAAGVTGALRVTAGAHSWTDVGAGFLAGNGLGVAMCAIHPRTPGPNAASWIPRVVPGARDLTFAFSF